MIQPQILDALLEAGASAEMIVAAVKAALSSEEAKRDARRAKDAARQRRVRGTRAAPEESRKARVTPRDAADAPPNEISNPPRPRSSDEDLAPLADKLVEAWNASAAAAGAVSCRALNPRRRMALKARLREHGEQALFEAVRNLAASPFHCGKNPRGWRATLGWLIASPEAFQRMLEMVPDTAPPRPAMTREEQLASTERSAALLEKMGRTDEAAEMRRTAGKLRETIHSQTGES
jgi:hypothetical protein